MIFNQIKKQNQTIDSQVLIPKGEYPGKMRAALDSRFIGLNVLGWHHIKEMGMLIAKESTIKKIDVNLLKEIGLVFASDKCQDLQFKDKDESEWPEMRYKPLGDDQVKLKKPSLELWGIEKGQAVYSVQQFLEENNWGEYLKKFQEHGYDGKKLMEIKSEDLEITVKALKTLGLPKDLIVDFLQKLSEIE